MTPMTLADALTALNAREGLKGWTSCDLAERAAITTGVRVLERVAEAAAALLAYVAGGAPAEAELREALDAWHRLQRAGAAAGPQP